MRSHQGSLAHCSMTLGPLKPWGHGRGDGHKSQALVKAPHRCASTDRVAAACHPEEERGGAEDSADLERWRWARARETGEDSLVGGGPGGPSAGGLRPLSAAGPTVRAATLHQRAPWRWASGPAGLFPLLFRRAWPWVTSTVLGEAVDCLWGRRRAPAAEESDLPWHGRMRSCASCGGVVGMEQPNN
ncbi:hypothetical protein NDU88_005856 [Pleurodeles waltl]|uniref:Uncharacterized protein n=1 Tax=Pleurodeles waltl TaxID=8319 RepID=A0AAV7LMB2_PLEWA|nr:hypothetical protein NDU88_005856 [Pleurodeles waltl]